MRIPKTTERWFPVKEDKDKAETLIRHLENAEIADIAQAVMSRETRYEDDGAGGMRPVIKQSGIYEQNKAIFCAALIGWKNVFDDNDKPIECTDENKIWAMRKIDGFVEHIDRSRARLAKDLSKEREKREKN